MHTGYQDKQKLQLTCFESHPHVLRFHYCDFASLVVSFYSGS